MDKCYSLWEGYFGGKPTFTEEKDNGDKNKKTIKKYLKRSEEKNGAILFAVCRGNYSEGYNFKDKFARGVILVGVPHLNINDFKVKLKNMYYNNNYKYTIDNYNKWYLR